MITVSKSGAGDFDSLQKAILSVDDAHADAAVIFVEPGVYEEKVFIRKRNIQIIGADRDSTVIRYGDGAKKLRADGTIYGTFNTATVLFAGSDITVRNLTIENSAGSGRIAGQAVAAYVASDRTAFYNCAFLGHQDTIFTGFVDDGDFLKLMLPEFFEASAVPVEFPVTRNYFEDCYICGDVDYIFGPNVAYFNRCNIHTRLLASESVSYITAASTPLWQEYGFVFHGCRLIGEGTKGSVYLGRPWRDFAKTAFLACEMDAHIHPAGWHNWGKAKAEANCGYVEYGNTGAGADTSRRASFCKLLTNPDLQEYYDARAVLCGADGWNPAGAQE